MAKKITILGAGLSGLLTAYYLQNKGFDIEIVEARDRVGGRIHTIKDTNTQIEMGATWFNEAHTNFRNLLSGFNLDYYEQFMTGTSFSNLFLQRLRKKLTFHKIVLSTVSPVEQAIL